MTKKLSDHDKALFERAMKKKGIIPKGEEKPQRKRDPVIEGKVTPSPPRYLNVRSEFAGNDCMAFAQAGLQQRLLKQFRLGKLLIDNSLDLHNLTSDEAIEALDQFVDEAHRNHWRCVLIIHGKGYSSKNNTATLKNLTYDYAKEHERILALHSAIQSHGGTGASYLLLKK